jgi:hypothetical protein
MAALSKAWICSHLLTGIAGLSPAGAWMPVISVVFCQVEVSASHWLYCRRSPTARACVFVSFSVTRYNNIPLHLQRVGIEEARLRKKEDIL